MRTASLLLGEIEAMGVVFRAGGDWIQYRPKDALGPELVSQVREFKSEILAILRVREALAECRRLQALDLQIATGLDSDSLNTALGELYDACELKTNPEGFYWLIEPHEN